MFDSFDDLKILKEAGITEEDLKSIPKLKKEKAAMVRGLVMSAKNISEEDDVTVRFGIDDPLPGTGFISLSGEGIYIKNTAAFVEICKNANVIEIFPTTDGNVTFELTFHNDK